jgi:signal transduction histidine kinase
MFASGSATLAFTASAMDENLKLGAVLRRDLFLVYKEAINNAARHSASSRLEIELCMEGPWLLLRVADNGSGFDPAVESIGHGLTSMQRRARKMGALLDIDSHRGLGTTVRLRVPCRPGRWASVMINPT